MKQLKSLASFIAFAALVATDFAQNSPPAPVRIDFGGVEFNCSETPKVLLNAGPFKDVDGMNVLYSRMWMVPSIESKNALSINRIYQPLFFVNVMEYDPASWEKAKVTSAKDFVKRLYLPQITAKRPETTFFSDIKELDEVVRKSVAAVALGEKNIEMVETVMDGQKQTVTNGAIGFGGSYSGTSREVTPRTRDMKLFMIQGNRIIVATMMHYKDENDLKAFAELLGSIKFTKK